MGGSFISSDKLLMIFTGTDPDYSVEDYVNAVTANFSTPKLSSQTNSIITKLSRRSKSKMVSVFSKEIFTD